MAGRSEVLHLYRAILTRGKALRYTDGDYFRRQVRQEFKKWAESTDSAEIEVQIEVMATASVEHYCPCAIAARLRLCIVWSPDLLNPVLSVAVLTFVLQTTSGEVTLRMCAVSAHRHSSPSLLSVAIATAISSKRG